MKTTQALLQLFKRIFPGVQLFRASQVASVMRNSLANAGDARDLCSIPGSGKICWNRKWQPAPVFLPGEYHEQRRRAGYNPWDCKEWDTTESLSLSLSLSLTHTHTHTPLVVSSNLTLTKASRQPPRLQIPGPRAPAVAGPCPLSSPCASPTCLPWRPSLPL